MLSSNFFHLTAKSIAILSVLTATISHAELLSVKVSGTFIAVDPELTAFMSTGSKFSLIYTYNLLAADINTSAAVGHYRGAIQGASFSTSALSISSTGGDIIIGDNFTGTPFDQLSVGSQWWNASLTGLEISGHIPAALEIQLDDNTGSVFNDDLLPSTAPSLTGFDSARFTLTYAEHVYPGYATGVIRAYGSIAEISTIPEPGRFVLLMLGLPLLLRRKVFRVQS